MRSCVDRTRDVFADLPDLLWIETRNWDTLCRAAFVETQHRCQFSEA
jgi:hypothetical protein